MEIDLSSEDGLYYCVYSFFLVSSSEDPVRKSGIEEMEESSIEFGPGNEVGEAYLIA